MPFGAQKPVTGGSPSRRKKKKGKSIWDRIPGSKIVANTAKDVEEIARNTPGGLAFTAGAIDKALPRGPLERGKRRHGDFEDLKTIGRGQIQAIKDLRHPLRHPGYSLLTILALLNPAVKGASGATTVARTGKLPSRAPKKRKITYRPKDLDKSSREQRVLRVAANRKDKTPVTEQSVYVPLSKTPTTALAQKAGDKLRSKSHRLSKRRVHRELAKELDIRQRQTAANPLGVKAATKEAFTTKDPLQKLLEKPISEGVRELNAAVRAARLYRGAYVPPNWLGAQAVNLIHSGPTGYTRQVLAQKGGKRRRRDPATDQEIDRLMGETAAQAATDTGQTIKGGSGPIGTFTRGVGTTLGKATDRASRNRIWREEARKHGYGEKEIPALLKSARNGNPKSIKAVIDITKQAEPNAITFTRTPNLPGTKVSKLSKLDRAAADNIFLYKWLTGSTRYGGKTLAEHPLLSAEAATLGKEAPDIRELLAEVPEFMENYIPRQGMRGGFPLVNNPAAASLYDFPFEILRTLGHSKEDIRESSDILNPVQAALLNALTGFDPFRDQELGETQDSPLERARFGAATQLRSIPWLEWGRLDESEEERAKRLFPLSPLDIILRQSLGSSLHLTGFPVNPEVASRMKRQQDKKREPTPAKKRKRRRRRSSEGF